MRNSHRQKPTNVIKCVYKIASWWENQFSSSLTLDLAALDFPGARKRSLFGNTIGSIGIKSPSQFVSHFTIHCSLRGNVRNPLAQPIFRWLILASHHFYHCIRYQRSFGVSHVSLKSIDFASPISLYRPIGIKVDCVWSLNTIVAATNVTNSSQRWFAHAATLLRKLPHLSLASSTDWSPMVTGAVSSSSRMRAFFAMSHSTAWSGWYRSHPRWVNHRCSSTNCK